jgi:hypothetical protein
MPKEKKKVDPLAEAIKGLATAIESIAKDVELLKNKRPKGLSENLEDIAKRFPNRGVENQLSETPATQPLPDYLPVDEPPIKMKQIVKDVLGDDFRLEMDEMTDRAEYRVSVIVPDGYRPQQELLAYQNHHEVMRSEFINGLTRDNENITEQEIANKVKGWNMRHPKPKIPEDRRTKNISKIPGLGLNQLRDWCELVKKNITGNRDEVLKTN